MTVPEVEQREYNIDAVQVDTIDVNGEDTCSDSELGSCPSMAAMGTASEPVSRINSPAPAWKPIASVTAVSIGAMSKESKPVAKDDERRGSNFKKLQWKPLEEIVPRWRPECLWVIHRIVPKMAPRRLEPRM